MVASLCVRASVAGQRSQAADAVSAPCPPRAKPAELRPEATMRRALLGASLGLALSLTASPPALASGRTSDSDLKRDYYTNTAEIIKQIKEIFALGGELTSDTNKDKLQDFKKNTQAWVGDYRRLVGPGQTSYGLVYGVINSVLGYFTTVGIGNRALPKKVLEGQGKRIAQAETAIKREMQREGLTPITFA